MSIDPNSSDTTASDSDKIVAWYTLQGINNLTLLKNEYIKSSNSNTETPDSSNNADYILPQSSSSLLNESDLKNLSKETLALARNEIYARHGYIFSTEPFKSYFSAKKWYTPNPSFTGGNGQLNAVENKNIELIKKLESE